MSREWIVHRDEGPVAWIVINRPDRLNALAEEMRDQLADAIESASRRSRVIVITGAGPAFCTGADVRVMAAMVRDGDRGTFVRLIQAGARVVRAIRDASQPVIAAINGPAAGAGASLAAACDLRVASENATIGFTFGRIGLHPDWGATHFVPRAVGHARAAELFLTGRMVAADEACRIGLVHEVAAPAELEGRVRALANELAERSPAATALTKRSLAAGVDGRALDEALAREAEAQARCFGTDDLREGVAAFLERRAPVFSGS